MKLTPVATVLIVERRLCSCGMIFDAPAPHLHQLETAPSNRPFAQHIRPLLDPLRGEHLSPAIPELRTLLIIPTRVSSCQACFSTNADWVTVASYRPEPAPPPASEHPTIVTPKHIPTIEELI